MTSVFLLIGSHRLAERVGPGEKRTHNDRRPFQGEILFGRAGVNTQSDDERKQQIERQANSISDFSTYRPSNNWWPFWNQSAKPSR